MKKFLGLIFLFIVFSGIFIYILFPYQTVADKIITENINREKLDVHYSRINGNLNHTTLEDVKIYEVVIPKITIKHSIVNILKRKIDFYTSFEDIKITGNFGFNSAQFKGSGDISSVSRYLQNISLNGKILMDGEYNYDKNQLSAKIKSENTKVSSNGMNIDLGNSDAKITSSQNKVSLKIPGTSGKDRISADGFMLIDYRNFLNSRLNFKGDLLSDKLNISFRLNGSLRSPNFSFR